MNIIARKGTTCAAIAAWVILAAGSALASDLGEKIRRELDASPYLKMQQVKMRLLEEKDGCVSLEMVEGPKFLRDQFRRGTEVESAALMDSNLKEDSVNALRSVRRTLKTIKHFEGVKEVSLTGASNSVMDQAENYYNDASEQLAQDDSKARDDGMKLLRKSAKLGFARAQCDLGGAYASGSGVEKDDKEAVLWFRKAAENGDASAQFNLGKMYAAGRGTGKDFKQALEWYRKAAEQERTQDARVKGLNAVAFLLATCPEESLRDGNSALEYVKRAQAAASPQMSLAVTETLAAAYARCGRFAEAVEAQQKWIQLLAGVKNLSPDDRETIAANGNRRLAMYKNNQAYSAPN